ncbi:MAG: hypothetical protein RL211_1286 [Pseudomonadota bacterium]|jgi:hypothetical protein
MPQTLANGPRATTASWSETLNTFKAATTAPSRQSQVDAVIAAWANASSWYTSSVGQAISVFAQSQPALYAQLSILERFNAQPVIERYTRANSSYFYDPAQARYVGYTYYTVSIEGQRLPFFQSAYDSLKASTYQRLYLQTEGKALLDQVELVIDDKGLRLGFEVLDATLATKLPCVHQRTARDRGKLRNKSGLSPRRI